MNLASHIAWLVKTHGSLRAAAAATSVDVSTLSRLRSGERGQHVSDDLLARLGLERVVTYRRARA